MKQKRQQQNPEQKITKLEKELALKSGELKIETALEKVRNKAMRMKKPDDMLEVCKTISLQLESLGTNEIRNIQTAIFYPQRGTYMNYEYYAKHNKTIITETSYTNHKMHKAFARKMLKGKGEFFVTHIKGKKVKDWIAYQKTTNVFIDKYLKTTSSLSYYWFSLGPVALGISTYHPLNEEEIILFKRFLKVFELAYRRYLDIEKAEAHAREAQIEASLERVRAVAMSMHKSEDLLNVCEIMYGELYKLGFYEIRNAMINIHNDDKKTFLNYDYSDEIGKSVTLLDYNANPVMEKQIKQSRKANDAFSEAIYKGKDLEAWKEFRRKYGERDDPRIKIITALYYYFYSIENGMIGISTFFPIGEEKLSLLKRFRNVFSLAYQRYSDIALAEARARENQIELALERVRASAMAMHSSKDVGNATAIMFTELEKLSIETIRCGIDIMDQSKIFEVWASTSTDEGKVIQIVGKLDSRIHPHLQRVQEAWERQDKFISSVLEGQDLENYYKKLSAAPDYRVPVTRVQSNKQFNYDFFFKEGGLFAYRLKPFTEEEIQILQRFTSVFGLTFRRYLDLQKAEAQAREAQIELALERIRARTMAMHKSDELSETAYVLFEQFRELGENPEQLSIGTVNEAERTLELWLTVRGNKFDRMFKVPIDEPIVINKIYNAWKEKNKSFILDISGAELKRYNAFRNRIPDFNEYNYIKNKDNKEENRRVIHCAFFTKGLLSLATPEPRSDETIKLLERFAIVFDGTYTRFLDLKKAEAQAREAKIEAALERVRSRTIGMQRSVELAETVSILFKQLLDLGVQSSQLRTCGIVTFKENEPEGEIWITDITGEIIADSFIAPYDEAPAYKAIYSNWKNGEKFLEINLKGDELLEHLKFVKNYSAVPNIDIDEIQKSISEIFFHVMFFSQGYLFIISYEPLSEFHEIFKRFGSVFQQAYTRFLDLQKAEAQAREAQIEASLERVRAVAMGMNKPEGLLNICEESYKEFKKLGFDNIRNVIIHIPNDKLRYFMDYDFSDLTGGAITKIEFCSHPIVDEYLEKIRSAADAYFEVVINKDQLEGWKDFRNKSGQKDDPRLDDATALYYYLFSIGIGDIGISTFKQIDESQIKILKRFRNVFDLAYRRYTDITLAESQAKEAKIEAALERVRSRTMGMQKSEELKEVIQVVFEQFVHLNIHIEHTGFIMDYKARDDMHIWLADQHEVPFEVTIPYFDCAHWNSFIEAKEKGIDFFANHLTFEEKNNFYQDLFKLIPGVPKETLEYYFNCPGLAISTVLLENVGLYIENFSGIPYSDEENVTLMRFGKVFQQTYTRFLDLQKAESQAREAQIETALERVRSRTMAMHQSSELAETAAVLFKQLIDLGIAPNRLYIAIMKDDSGIAEFWITDEDGSKVGSGFSANMNDNSSFQKMYTGWKKQKKSITIDMQGKELEDYFKHLSALNVPFKGGLSQKRRVQNIAYFSQGLIGIASPELQPEETVNLLERFAAVFNLTYRRFLDLQKAEAQTREAQIELALERVRARTMAMQNSNELVDTSIVLFHQLKILGIESIRTGVATMDEMNETVEVWSTSGMSANFEKKILGVVPAKVHPMFTGIFNSWKNKDSYFSYELKGNELKKYYHTLSSYLSYPEQKEFNEREMIYTFYFPEGSLNVVSQNELSEKDCGVVIRFAKVFGLVYTRFLDLKKAEAQAREAQIETALERVRAKAMAMHSSNDLTDTMGVLFTELPKLGINSLRCGVVLLSRDSQRGVFYAAATTPESDSFTMIGGGDMTEHSVFMNQYESWLKNENYFTTLSNEELQSYYEALFARLSIPYKPREHKVQTEHGYYFAFSAGMFYAWAEDPYSEVQINILNRFKAIIDLTFRRYIDLQKAEAQAREAEIEAALERVRSRTMAMQKSNELAETASHLFAQLNSLGIKPYRFNIAIVDVESEKCRLWSTTNEGKVIPSGPLIPLTEHNVFNQMYVGWKQQQNVLVIKLAGDERLTWTKYIMRYVSFNEYKPENIDLERLRHEPAIFSNFFFKQGFIVVHTIQEINETDLKIIQRFVNVFEQTFTRFLDLQKAEGQTREARIESSLERVRSRAMSMHSPDDLSETVSLFFNELKSLKVLPWRCGVGRIDEETRTTDLTTTSITKDGKITEVAGKLKQTGHPVLDGIFDHWKLQKEYYPVLRGDDINKYYSIIKPQIAYPDYPLDAVQYGHNIPFKEGFIFAWTENRLSEDELQIFRRFSSVLSLTYRRYMDLKDAEARATESVRQASLDRVRAEIASMRTADDLNRITPIIWRELKNLEVPFFRCGVYIIDEPQEKVQVYLTTPDGKSLGVLNLSFDSNKITSDTVEHWKNKQVYKQHWNKEAFINWTRSLIEIGQVQNTETYQGSAEPPDSLNLHFVPFAQGMLYVGDVNPLTDEKLELVKTLAEAFSIAYARYEDFKNLEEAKNKVEITLSELKSAQAQLVHSEKMASLGELTAGIAHEIKNPLNFVNNFSEVSRELLDEMKSEIQNKNLEEVIGLIDDLKQNLEKINQHGKRADSIVKGMLLHSRGTSGEKTLTDINDLLDQYVNLAYHGMRAQNKEFNITIEKDYDKTLEKINVVPQDISRVFLNIINNACYAAFDKKKNGANDFSPTLKVSTKKLNDKVEITIGDNGNGIPADHLDKIFQPFFTTKPSGEGTGLGLSLSYEIVTKVHGGELKVETKDGEGTQFIIILNA